VRGCLAVLLMLATTISIAATTDPLPGNSPPADAPSSAEGAGAGGAEGTGQSEEPIAVDLDIPPGLAEFLDEKYPEQSPAQRTAENAAAAASQDANDTAPNNSPASPNIEQPGDSENAEAPAPGSSEAAAVNADTAIGGDQLPSQASQNLSSAPIPQRLPESIQESLSEEVLSEETVSGEALEPNAAISAITESPTPVNLPNLSTPDRATVAVEDTIDDPMAALPFSGCFTAAADKYQVEEALLMGIAIVESSMDPEAISSSEALGLMQIKWPITANHLGITDRRALFDPCTNIDAGARYLRELLDDLAGFSSEPRRRLALASYRLGPNGFDPNVPLPANAQDYIEKVTAQERLLSAPAPERIVTTAGPVLPCLVQNLRGLAMTTHDPAQRSVQVGQWLDARGEGCSALALIQIRNNLPAWLGTALTPERATQVTDLLEQVINTTASVDTRPSRPRPQ
jgi:soluble lytic murein transglycosylase-like protein